MDKKSIFLSLFVLFSLFVFPSNDLDLTTKVYACDYKCKDNKVIGEYRGIKAYSNGEYTGGTGYCGTNTSGKITYGYKWQCVEYVKRFYHKIFGKLLSQGWANVYCSDDFVSKNKLNRRWNCDPSHPDVPQSTNIIVNTTIGGTGHIAIVKKVGSDYIEVVHQNLNKCEGEKRLNMTRKKNSQGKEYACVNIFGQQGKNHGCWLWPK